MRTRIEPGCLAVVVKAWARKEVALVGASVHVKEVIPRPDDRTCPLCNSTIGAMYEEPLMYPDGSKSLGCCPCALLRIDDPDLARAIKKEAKEKSTT